MVVKINYLYSSIILPTLHIISLFLPLVLARPAFADVTVNEGDLLELVCVTMNSPEISSMVHIQSPSSVPRRLPNATHVISVPNVTRDFAGTYTCIVASSIDDSVVNDTSEVIIQCKLPI